MEQSAVCLTGVAFSVAARDEAGAFRAGAGVTSRTQQTEMAAGSLTWIFHCRDKKS